MYNTGRGGFMKRIWVVAVAFIGVTLVALFVTPRALGLAELEDFALHIQTYNYNADDYYTPKPDYIPEPQHEPEPKPPEPEPELCIKEEAYAFMEQFNGEIAVFFENLESGFTFAYQGDRVFFGASATKAPFALYIYLKAEEGRTNLNTIMHFTEGDYWQGSGIIRHRYEYGQHFTQRRLLHLMLVPSDNIATRILRRHHGLGGYREFIESIGGDPHFVQNLTYSYLSANEAGLIMRESFNYIQSNGRYSDEFLQNLLANRYPFVISDYPVASKSGWAANFGGAWHDMAIVLAPSPYTLSLLSPLAGAPNDRVKYDAISMFFQDFNYRHFVSLPYNEVNTSITERPLSEY